jgi:hypothetical protein
MAPRRRDLQGSAAMVSPMEIGQVCGWSGRGRARASPRADGCIRILEELQGFCEVAGP